MLVNILVIGIKEGEELKAPRHASTAATRDDCLPYSWQIILLELNYDIYNKELLIIIIVLKNKEHSYKK